jgi:hypothetical protein
VVETGVQVGVNQVVRVDLTLRLGAVTETIEVSTAAPLMQAETSSLGTIETERRISELPLNGRNFIQLAYLGSGANGGQTGSNVSGEVFENERASAALAAADRKLDTPFGRCGSNSGPPALSNRI